MAATTEPLGGIFSGTSMLTPEVVRLWLQVARTTVGWSVAEAAHRSDVPIADVERLEATGEPSCEEDDDALASLAAAYLPETLKRAGGTDLACQLSSIGNALRLDADFALARFLRHRRAELGLSIDEVVARAGGAIKPEDLRDGEWDGTRTLNDFDDGLRALASALEVPFLTLRLIAERGSITEADVDEWVAWRDAQRTPARRAVRKERG